MLCKSRGLREWCFFFFWRTLSAFRIYSTFFFFPTKKEKKRKKRRHQSLGLTAQKEKSLFYWLRRNAECLEGNVENKCSSLGTPQRNKNISLWNKNILLCDHLRRSSVSRVQQFNKWKSKSIKMNEAKQVFCIRWQKLFWELTNQWVQWYNDGSSASGTVPGNGPWMAIPIREAVLLSNTVLPMLQDLNTPE